MLSHIKKCPASKRSTTTSNYCASFLFSESHWETLKNMYVVQSTNAGLIISYVFIWVSSPNLASKEFYSNKKIDYKWRLKLIIKYSLGQSGGLPAEAVLGVDRRVTSPYLLWWCKSDLTCKASGKLPCQSDVWEACLSFENKGGLSDLVHSI